jgi:hypothetical protein
VSRCRRYLALFGFISNLSQQILLGKYLNID